MPSLPGSAHLLRALVVAGCLLPIVGACGGRSDTQDYLYGSDGTISLGATSSTAGRSSTGGGTRSGGGTTSRGGGGPISAGTGPIGSGGTTIAVGGSGPIFGGDTGIGGDIFGGGTGTAGTGTAGTSFGGISMGGFNTAGSSAAGAAGQPAIVPISCGNQTCDGNTQVCCAGLGGFGCLAKNQACNGAVLNCTTDTDCSGNRVCCVSITGDVADASNCKDRCDNMGLGRDRQLCDVAADCLPPFRFCTATIFGISVCTRRP